MKQGKQLTTGKRIIFFILVVLAVEVALFIAGFFMGFLKLQDMISIPFCSYQEQLW